MSQNNSKNIALIIATIFLLLALIPGWPYGFFTLLRWIVFVTSGYVAWLAFDAGKNIYGWIYVIIVILFNPFAIVIFERETWMVVDALVAVFNVSSVWLLQIKHIS